MGIGQIRPPLAVLMAEHDRMEQREREIDRTVIDALCKGGGKPAAVRQLANRGIVSTGLLALVSRVWREQHA